MKHNNLLIDKLFPITTSVNADDTLTIGNLNIHELARKFGTPLYIYDYETIKKIYNDFYNAFEMQYGEVDILYASKNPHETVQVNISGTINILEGCKKYKIKRFIQASSIYVNSIEGGYYKCSKKAAEDYIEEFEKKNKVNYTILRFGSLYGPRADKNNGIYKIISSAVAKNKIIYYGNIKAARSYIHVEDAAEACVKILKKNFINEYIILTGPKEIKLRYFLHQLSKKLGIKKVLFLNKKETGHYVKTPNTFKPKVGIKYNKIKYKNFFNEIIYLTNKLKKNKKI